jgi:hypothetical protein
MYPDLLNRIDDIGRNRNRGPTPEQTTNLLRLGETRARFPTYESRTFQCQVLGSDRLNEEEELLRQRRWRTPTK